MVTSLLYQSYWYGNALALTIYVNANVLRSSSQQNAATCAKAGRLPGAVPPRG